MSPFFKRLTALSKNRDAAWLKRYTQHDKSMLEQCMLLCALDSDMEVFDLVLQELPHANSQNFRSNFLGIASRYDQTQMMNALIPLCDEGDLRITLGYLIGSDHEWAAKHIVEQTRLTYPDLAAAALVIAVRNKQLPLVEHFLPLVETHQLDNALFFSIEELPQSHNPILQLIFHRMLDEGVVVGHGTLERVIYHERDDLWALFLPASTPTAIEDALNKMQYNKKNSKANVFAQIHQSYQDRQVLEQEMSNISEDHHTRKARKI